MNIELEKGFIQEKLLPALSEESKLHKKLSTAFYFGDKFDLEITSTPLEDLEIIYAVAKEVENRSLMVHLSPLIKIRKNVSGTIISKLKVLDAAIVEYMRTDMIDGWLYKVDEFGIPHPYLVKSISYEMSRNQDAPYVVVELLANTPGTSRNRTTSITFVTDDIQGKTIEQILASESFYKETPELKKLYEEHLALFRLYQPQYNKQFWIDKVGYSNPDLTNYSKLKIHLGKAVNDEEVHERKVLTSADSSFWRKHGVNEGFTDVPFHAYIVFFHLDLHQQMWVHASNVKPYEYRTDLKDKLVLPHEHRDLIDILVEDMDVLMEDIIDGKSGGTTILCTGEPGLGKTLSAEVYSEVVQRPLYKVHSGQLGLKSDEVEKKLEAVLKRATRWGAVLLIDEADVYIRTRDNDIAHNAVVAAFLRTLEYFSGLLFMTTNRGQDVDDAILSRCIAVIKYDYPTPANARRIWEVLSKQFGIELSEALLDELIQRFPRISGRDIKELLKLTSRFAKGKQIPLSIDVFRKCAQFRGVTFKEEELALQKG